MRVISGERRGLNLYTLEGDNTRPTLDRVKETMFNVINFDIPNKNCLDVFSGSGNLSIEAMSRGANTVYLIENDRQAFSVIEQNLEKSKYIQKVKCFNKDYKVALNNISDEGIKFSIVFLDPPYNENFYSETLNLLVELNLLEDDAIVVCEHLKTVVISHEGYYLLKDKSFSKNMISFLKLKEDGLDE